MKKCGISRNKKNQSNYFQGASHIKNFKRTEKQNY